MTLAIYTRATEGMQDFAKAVLEETFLDPAVDTPLSKDSGNTARALHFLAICRTFRSGGTRIRTGDTMIFSHMQKPIGMRKTRVGIRIYVRRVPLDTSWFCPYCCATVDMASVTLREPTSRVEPLRVLRLHASPVRRRSFNWQFPRLSKVKVITGACTGRRRHGACLYGNLVIHRGQLCLLAQRRIEFQSSLTLHAYS